MNNSNGGGTGITGYDNSLLFDWLPLQINNRLSQGVFYEELDDCWQTEDSWGRLMTKSFNGGGTGINGDDRSLLFEWLTFQLKHRLSQGIVSFPPWLFPVTILWRLPIPFGCGMMNAIWVCGGVVCLFICLLMANKSWEPTFWRDNCIHVLVSVPGIKLITSLLYQYNSN